jgi:TolB protein
MQVKSTNITRIVVDLFEELFIRWIPAFARTAFFLITLLFISGLASNALTKIDITRSNISSVPIAIQIVSSSGSKGDYHKNSILSLVSADLESCGLFKIIDQESYIDELHSLDQTPNFISWRQVNASVLILLDIDSSGGKVSTTFKVWDVFSEKPLVFKKLDSQAKVWRRIAHKVSDEIYRRLTGEDGYFDTKIAYVSVSGRGHNKVRRLAIMDQDGANHEYLTNGESIVLTPRFSQDLSRLIYFAYDDPLRPSIKVFDLHTNRTRLLREFAGMAYAPRYTPDGRSILLAIEKRGVSNIYLYDLNSMEMRQLTFCTSICTSPSASPDQSAIVLNSDMSGGRNLFVMSLHGGSPRRISFNAGSYANPVWSPKGNLIAFTKIQEAGDFYIGIMRPDGSSERILTHGRLVEGPAWAPNGKAIVFERELTDDSGRHYTKLYKIDIVSRKEQEIETPAGATDAYWSNQLK